MRAPVWNRIQKYLLIAFGAACYAAGFQFIAYPNALVTGGVTGISMIVNYLTGFPVGVLGIIINIPLFFMAWRRFGWRFLVGSFVGMLCSNVFVDLFSMIDFVVTRQPILSAVYAGLMEGLGLGIVYRVGATTGGTDIIAKLLRAKYQYINLSTIVLMLDVSIIVAFAVVFNQYDNSLYAIIAMYIDARMIDLVISGGMNSKVCYIITDESSRVKDAIMEKLNRGVTFLRGEGAWSGKEKKIILCVIKSRQIVELKSVVEEIDPNAFMFMSESREVFGEGFTDIGYEG